MVATAGQNFDQLFVGFDNWPHWFLGLWPLTALNFHWLCTHLRKYMEECIVTPPLP